MKRIHLIISGQVQGVGFRAWVRNQALRANIMGWVNNRDDGNVEVIAEGKATKLTSFVHLCRKGSPLSRVELVTKIEEPYIGEFQHFSIL